jgi:hypothetical protein
MPTYGYIGGKAQVQVEVHMQVEVHIAYCVLLPLLDHTLEEEAHGNQLVPDLSYIEQVVLSTWRYSFHWCLSNLLNTTVTYVKAKYTTLNAFELT